VRSRLTPLGLVLLFAPLAFLLAPCAILLPLAVLCLLGLLIREEYRVCRDCGARLG
jgi:hypothetical protein